MPQAKISTFNRTLTRIKREWSGLSKAQKLTAIRYVLNNWERVDAETKDRALPLILNLIIDEVTA